VLLQREGKTAGASQGSEMRKVSRSDEEKDRVEKVRNFVLFLS